MKPPPDSIPKRIGTIRATKQIRGNKTIDATLPLFTNSLHSKYLGIEGVKPRLTGQLGEIGNSEAFAPHRRMLALRDMRTDPSIRPTALSGLVVPNYQPSVYSAKPIHFMDPLGLQAKTRYNQGNVDLKQRPLLVGFNESRLK